MINKFYLDKEKDIIVNLYKTGEDEITYILETPNHNTGNLITNLAQICGLETTKNEQGLKVIIGTIPASINGDNEEVYIFRLGGIKIANIYEDRVEIKAKIPAITKTLMSQTKNYKLPINKTIVKTYIIKKLKFRTDLHTHMNANLSPDCLIALGIVHQVKYPLYYIKKLNLKPDKKTILFFGGGEFGLGKTRTVEIFESFVEYCENMQIITISGKNEKMKSSFEKIVSRHRKKDSIVVFEYTSQVPEFMSISDLVVTKPGGLTTTESLASHLPMVIINPIPGQEEKNAKFLVKNGIAIWIKKQDNVEETLKNLFSHPETLESMKQNTQKLAKLHSTKDICDILLKN